MRGFADKGGWVSQIPEFCGRPLWTSLTSRSRPSYQKVPNLGRGAVYRQALLSAHSGGLNPLSVIVQEELFAVFAVTFHAGRRCKCKKGILIFKLSISAVMLPCLESD